ncbi:hypothetical protein PLEOSDRAFT_1088028, partial [Pleurotus ostreatus PC15]
MSEGGKRVFKSKSNGSVPKSKPSNSCELSADPKIGDPEPTRSLSPSSYSCKAWLRSDASW